jgi:sarcosine oxidase
LPIKQDSYPLSSSPIFIWNFGFNEEDMIYGFPSLDGETIKVASESCVNYENPEQINRVVSKEEEAIFCKDQLSTRLNSIVGLPVRSAVCQYTVAPQSKFIINNHPEMPSVLIASCCSGHGFKHSAALGEALAGKMIDVHVAGIDLSVFERGF